MSEGVLNISLNDCSTFQEMRYPTAKSAMIQGQPSKY